MKKRRSFFLLEVMIAILLVEAFAYFSIQSFFRSLNIQKKALREIESSQLTDLGLMQIICEEWNKLDDLSLKEQKIEKELNILNQKQKYVVTCKKSKKLPLYLLQIDKSEKYNKKKKNSHSHCYIIAKKAVILNM